MCWLLFQLFKSAVLPHLSSILKLDADKSFFLGSIGSLAPLRLHGPRSWLLTELFLLPSHVVMVIVMTEALKLTYVWAIVTINFLHPFLIILIIRQLYFRVIYLGFLWNRVEISVVRVQVSGSIFVGALVMIFYFPLEEIALAVRIGVFLRI